MIDPKSVNYDLLFHERDLALVQRTEDETQRDVIACSITNYRHPDQFNVGDVVPNVPVVELATGQEVDLPGTREQPLVLFFGSYT